MTIAIAIAITIGITAVAPRALERYIGLCGSYTKDKVPR